MIENAGLKLQFELYYAAKCDSILMIIIIPELLFVLSGNFKVNFDEGFSILPIIHSHKFNVSVLYQ